MTARRTTAALTALGVLLGAGALAAAGSPLATASTTAATTTTTAATTTAATSTAATTDDTTGCETGSLPTVVRGAPAALRAGLPRGYWVWHDGAGWHLRVTHATTQQLVFSGTITASRPLTATKVRDERHDVVALSTDHRTAAFRFTNYGAVDGLDLVAHCAGRVSFSLWVDGHRIATDRVRLGRTQAHPATNPFAVIRH